MKTSLRLHNMFLRQYRVALNHSMPVLFFSFWFFDDFCISDVFRGYRKTPVPIDTEYLSVFCPNVGGYGPENSEYRHFSRSDQNEILSENGASYDEHFQLVLIKLSCKDWKVVPCFYDLDKTVI